MSDFKVSHQSLQKSIKKNNPDINTSISLSNFVQIFFDAILIETDMAEPTLVKKILCKEVKNYCADDQDVIEAGKIIDYVQSSTENAITAVESKDEKLLKKAYENLKTYQKIIKDLEFEAYRDELTGVWNRRYLYNKKIDNGKFNGTGVVFAISIEGFTEINKMLGRISGDKLLKYILKTLHKSISDLTCPIIRLDGAYFIVLVPENNVSAIKEKLHGIQESINSKTFTYNLNHFNIGMYMSCQKYNQESVFDEVYDNLFKAVNKDKCEE